MKDEAYIRYWGLEQHPFLLAPDSRMMYMAGQYYECFERLKYAINTGKGGVLIVSEDAGLGKTTILMRLIDEMKRVYGENFRYAFIDHPMLRADQIIAHIARSISGRETGEYKLQNLMILKDALVETKKQGGKNIIIVDEGQLLCGARDILQEMRTLINLTYNNEYLHTFILSGQKPLWEEVKNMPEFWQRLPVRYYFVPLKLEETKELIRYRLLKAGLSIGRDIFSQDAYEIIQRYSRGSPRTIIALADLSLLIGYSDRSNRISFKELSKAIHAMSGKGESLPYVIEDKKRQGDHSVGASSKVLTEGESGKGEMAYPIPFRVDGNQDTFATNHIRPFFVFLAVLFAIIAGATIGYHYTFAEKRGSVPIIVKQEIVAVDKEESSRPMVPQKTEFPEKEMEEIAPINRYVVISKDAANIRNMPYLGSERIGLLFKGETLKLEEERTDSRGTLWYKVRLYGNREGWLSGEVVTLRWESAP